MKGIWNNVTFGYKNQIVLTEDQLQFCRDCAIAELLTNHQEEYRKIKHKIKEEKIKFLTDIIKAGNGYVE